MDENNRPSIGQHFDRMVRNKWLVLVTGVFFGIIIAILARAITVKPPYPHFHANFAIFINGTQEALSGPGYYEEVSACTVHDTQDVKSRAHMHDNNNHVIHIHDTGVTWSDFFTNIGYTVGDKILTDGSNIYIDGQENKNLTFLLNGHSVNSVAGLIINSQDSLLINYGNDNGDVIRQHYNAIVKDAPHFNATKDPAACQGKASLSIKNRLKAGIGMRYY
ncbi:MAG: hypothetical protein NVS1B7_6480 [Candidatus Saccharimonadales bacterium]